MDIKNLTEIKQGLQETIPDSFRKDELLNFIKEQIKSIDITLDLAEDIIGLLKDKTINDTSGYIFLQSMYPNLEIKGTKVESMVYFLIGKLNMFKKESGAIIKYISDMEDIVIKDNIKLRDALMYRITNDIYFTNRYSLDVLNYILSMAKLKKVAKNNGEDPEEVTDSNVSGENWYRTLVDHHLNFVDLMTNRYLDFNASDLKDSKYDTLIPLKSYESDGFLKTIIDKMLGRNKPIQILGTYGFKYSPVLVIGKMVIKAQVAKRQSMIKKQEMLKYKIIDIKAMGEDGTMSNEKVEKAIAYYEKEIDELEYKINKIYEE